MDRGWLITPSPPGAGAACFVGLRSEPAAPAALHLGPGEKGQAASRALAWGFWGPGLTLQVLTSSPEPQLSSVSWSE